MSWRRCAKAGRGSGPSNRRAGARRPEPGTAATRRRPAAAGRTHSRCATPAAARRPPRRDAVGRPARAQARNSFDVGGCGCSSNGFAAGQRATSWLPGPQFGPQTPAHWFHPRLVRCKRCPVIAPDAACSHDKSHTGSVVTIPSPPCEGSRHPVRHYGRGARVGRLTRPLPLWRKGRAMQCSRWRWEMGAFFWLRDAGVMFFVGAWLLMVFAGIVADDVGI
jgi:hypothetical protein